MPKIVVEGPDGKKYAFPDTMPRSEINTFMKERYGTKARNETVNDYLARVVREQDATKARAKSVTKEATAAGRAEGERAAERMGVDNPLMMAFAAPAIGMAQQAGARPVFDREGTMLPDEAAGLAAINAAGFLVPGMVNKEFGARVEEGRRQRPGAAFAGDVAGGFLPGEMIGAGVTKAAQAIAPGVSAIGRMFKGKPAAAPAPTAAPTAATELPTFYHGSPGKIEGDLRPSSEGLFGPGVYLTPDKARAGAYAGNAGKIAEATVSGKLATYDQWKSATKAASKGVKPGPKAQAEIERRAIADLEERGFVGVQANDTTTVWNPANLGRKPESMTPKPPETPQQAARFETPGSPEYEAAVAKGLDMSQAGRMARAREQGFDTDTVLYHGTPENVEAFKVGDTGAIYMASDPEAANRFARFYYNDTSAPYQEGANVMPLYVRGRLKDVPQADSGQWRQVSDKLRQETQAAGFDGARVQYPDGSVVTVIFDPSNIRSVNAAFDPDKAASSTLLAAAPFAAVGGAGLTSERELGSKMKRDKKD